MNNSQLPADGGLDSVHHSPPSDVLHPNSAPRSSHIDDTTPDQQNILGDQLIEHFVSEKTSKMSKIHSLTSQTKAKTKALLHIDGSAILGAERDQPYDDLSIIQDDPAFNPSSAMPEFQRKDGHKSHGPVDRTLDGLQSLATTILHPKRAVKTKSARTAASQLSSIQRSQLSQKEDLELLEAHEALSQAESRGSSGSLTDDEEEDEDKNGLVDGLQNKIVELETRRESLRVAWTTSHIDRVRVVSRRYLDFPSKEAFLERDTHGKIILYKWEKWLGYFLVYHTQGFAAQYIDDFDDLPFDLETFRMHAERAIIASAPWQAWLLDVRSVYRWESPARTGKWLAIYVVVWYTEHVMSFIWGYIIYIVIKNRYYPSTVKSLRESIQRAEDRHGIARQFGELIDKHGQDDWLQPVIDELGPYLQLQLGDIANLLEVLQNFYHWKKTGKTAGSLFFFASCLAISALTDLKFSMKVFWFVMGVYFFVSLPIASRYTKYRYLVSPFKWVLWDIPTHAEWSLQYLRRQSQLSREKMIVHGVDKKQTAEINSASKSTYTGLSAGPRVPLEPRTRPRHSTTSTQLSISSTESFHTTASSSPILSFNSILSFHSSYNSRRGYLVIHASGIRFQPSHPTLSRSIRQASLSSSHSPDPVEPLFDIPFASIAEMQKPRTKSRVGLKLHKREEDVLELRDVRGEVYSVGGLKGKRDEAFNALVGFSGLQWQVLQSGTQGRGREREVGAEGNAV